MERAVILRTERLAVTTWLPEDSKDLFRLHSDPITMAFILGRTEALEESSARLTEYLHEQATRGWTKWRVENLHGEMIGRAGFGPYGHDRELGYTLRPSVWGQGLATELAVALIKWHSANPDFRGSNGDEPTRLWAFAAVDNAASLRVMEKAGLRFVEIHEHHGRPFAFFVKRDSTSDD